MTGPATNRRYPLPAAESIPAELRQLRQWVAWKWAGQDKLPVDIHTGALAKVNDQATWGSLQEACVYAKRRGLGIGFVFTADDPFCGVDFDDIRDPQSGEIGIQDFERVTTLDSYTEISPSGKGVKTILKARMDRAHKGTGLEVYDRGRFFTITAEHLPGTPDTIQERQAEVDTLIAAEFGPVNQQRADPVPGTIRDGERNNALASIAGTLRRRGLGQEAIEAALLGINSTQCTPPLAEDEVRDIARSISHYDPAESPRETPTPERNTWPDPLAEAAYYGLPGALVRAIEPHTEADPGAILLQMLIAYGNIIGRGAHFVVEADRHGVNEYGVLVGITSKGRKGTSWGRVRALLGTVDADWAGQRVLSGLSSGEGLIWAVRDAISRTEAVREKGKPTGQYQEVVSDPGISDKRLLVLEDEFASTLKVLGREGNTLSPVIRRAWDTGILRSLTKNSPAVATGAHISIVAHITKDELRRYLDTTEAGNGFANRFLWVCARRSKCLPEGSNIGQADFSQLERRLSQAVDFGKKAGEITRDDMGRAMWRQVYPELSEGRPGLLGAVTSRAEAHVTRLSCIYALLDMSYVVRPEHLLAALALWEYCEASARFIFGDSLGDPDADELLRSLRTAPAGLTRSEISRGLFARNKSAPAIERMLQTLLEHNLAKRVVEKTEGRDAERWLAVGRGTTLTTETTKPVAEGALCR